MCTVLKVLILNTKLKEKNIYVFIHMYYILLVKKIHYLLRSFKLHSIHMLINSFPRVNTTLRHWHCMCCLNSPRSSSHVLVPDRQVLQSLIEHVTVEPFFHHSHSFKYYDQSLSKIVNAWVWRAIYSFTACVSSTYQVARRTC